MVWNLIQGHPTGPGGLWFSLEDNGMSCAAYEFYLWALKRNYRFYMEKVFHGITKGLITTRIVAITPRGERFVVALL